MREAGVRITQGTYIFTYLQPLIIISNIGLMTTKGGYSEPCQTSKMVSFAKIVNGF